MSYILPQVAPLLRFLIGTLCDGSSEKLQDALAAGTVRPEVKGRTKRKRERCREAEGYSFRNLGVCQG